MAAIKGTFEVKKNGYGYCFYYYPVGSSKATLIGNRRKTKKEAIADMEYTKRTGKVKWS